MPRQFWRSIGLFVLACLCGLLAAGAFLYASTNTTGWLDTLLGSKIDNVYARAMYTGLAVLAIVRSKLLQVRDIDVGLEFFYSEARLRCLSKIRVAWISWKADYTERNIAKIAGQPTFEDTMFDNIRAAVDDADPQYKTSILSQIDELKKNRPAPPLDLTKPEWLLYFRALINIVLANCGPAPLQKFGFDSP